MKLSLQLVSLYTIVRKDFVRMMRIWSQTFLPSAVTSVLYFVVFGTLIGGRIGEMGGVEYIAFIVPGLVMLHVVTNSYSNTATTFFTSKFFSRSIDELLVSPSHPVTIIAGFVLGGLVRGVLVGIIVTAIALFFSPLAIAHPFVAFYFLILSSLVFSLLGLINGVFAKNFDAITIVPTFVLTPLVYLGGVFYATDILPVWMKMFTFVNPIFYLVNGFRYGFIGVTDVSLWTASSVLIGLISVSLGIAYLLIKKGLGLKQ